MSNHIITRHRLTYDNNGCLCSPDGTFDAVQYGRMKFGSLTDIRAIGLELGRCILAEAPDCMLFGKRIMAPFLYTHVPSAAAMVAKYAFMEVNNARARIGLERIQTRLIYTPRRPNVDYSKFTIAERISYLRRCGLELITTPLDGYDIVLLDDIRITGTYGCIVQELVSDYKIASFTEIYWASIDPEVAKRGEGIENVINSSAGTSLQLINDILVVGQLWPTLRTLKLILGHKDLNELKAFLERLSEEVLIDLYEAACGTGRDLFEIYPDGFNVLSSLVQSKNEQQIAGAMTS